MVVPTLTPVSAWPTRKLPQATFDAGVRTSMNQISTMVSELNVAIPQINEAATGLVTAVETAAAQSAVAVTKAAEAAASATQAKISENIVVPMAKEIKDAVAIVTAGSGFPLPDPSAVGQFLCVTEDSFALSGVKAAEIQTKARAYFISG